MIERGWRPGLVAAGAFEKVTKPMASSSRLIALFGLMGILALFMGCGITLL